MATPLERFHDALHYAAHAIKLDLDRRLKPLGLTRAAWVALARVARADTPPTQVELAALVGIEATSLVSLIDRLEGDGFVQRTPDGTDRRAKRVKATASGNRLYAKIHQE